MPGNTSNIVSGILTRPFANVIFDRVGKIRQILVCDGYVPVLKAINAKAQIVHYYIPSLRLLFT